MKRLLTAILLLSALGMAQTSINATKVNGIRYLRANESLQSAITDTAGVLYVPTMSYSTSATINLKSNLTIECARGATLAFTGTSAGFLGTGVTNVTLRNCKVDSTATTAHHVFETDSASSSILLDGNYFKGAAVNNVTYGPENGYVWLGGSNITIRNNTFDTTYGIALNSTTGAIEVSGNWFYSYITGVYLNGVAGSPTNHALVMNNHFVTMNGTNVLNGRDAILAVASNYFTLSHNDIAQALEHCIYVSDSSNHLVVSDNNCTGWQNLAGIQIRGHGGDNTTYNNDVTVNGNVATGGTTAGTYGFLFQGLKGLTATGNRAHSNQNTGFYINNVISGAFNGNAAEYNGGNGFYVVDLLGLDQDLTFNGNVANGNSTASSGSLVGFIVALTGGFASKNIKFVSNLGGDNQAVPTQRNGFGVNATSGGSTLAGVEFIGNGGTGNTVGLYTTTTAPSGVTNMTVVNSESAGLHVYNPLLVGATNAVTIDPSLLTAGRNLQAPDKAGVIATTADIFTLLNRQAPVAPITGTGAEAVVYTYSMPANTMAAGKGVRITCRGFHATGSASTSWNIRFGGTSVAAQTIGTTNDHATAIVEVWNNSGVTNAQTTHINILQHAASFASAAAPGTAAIDTTGSVAITCNFNVANTDTFTPEGFSVEIIR